MSVYPPWKLMVFVDGMTAFVEERNKELPCTAEKVLRAMKNGSGGEGFEAVDHGRRTGERTCWSRHVRNSGLGHSIAAVAHLAL